MLYWSEDVSTPRPPGARLYHTPFMRATILVGNHLWGLHLTRKDNNAPALLDVVAAIQDLPIPRTPYTIHLESIGPTLLVRIIGPVPTGNSSTGIHFPHRH
jgi:hypothetical protein